VLQFEQCLLDPAGQLRRTYEHPGVDPDFLPADLAIHPNDGKVRGHFEPWLLAEIVAAYRHDVRQTLRLLPDFDPALWPHFAR